MLESYKSLLTTEVIWDETVSVDFDSKTVNRQQMLEERADTLHESGFNDLEINKLDDLIINLSPIRFT